MKPRLLDLFCGAGGCTAGYQRAGFYVVGVDIRSQPNYCGDEFVQADALTVLRHVLTGEAWEPELHESWLWLADFDAIHASPPCQFATAYRRTGNVGDHENLIPQTRELLEATGLPYVIENVEEARDELRDPTLVCGSMFDGPTVDIQRHRLFETNWPLDSPAWPCRHKLSGVDRFPGGRSKQRTGSSRGLVRGTVEIAAMGIDWMTLPELSQAIPPAYTELVGHQLMSHVRAVVA
jgi:DNA (cytosine-5)-methyltransferase 1